MPIRKVPLVTDQYYHVFNRGVNKQFIFKDAYCYKRAMEILKFYSFANLEVKFSKFLKLSRVERAKAWDSLVEENKKLVEVVCFCLMPNHFHFLLKQTADNGISKFMSNFQNSYTRYFNTRHERIGHLFQGQFKAVRVEDDNQLLHLSRYIHLNPYSSFVVKKTNNLIDYSWSSFPEYLGLVTGICKKDVILAFFKGAKDYRKFVFDQADYQRELDIVKHLALES